MTDEKIIVLVSDKGDSKHGEISVLDDPEKAERLVETLLEAGFEADRIRVFSGKASEFQVSHRPIVALVADGEVGEPKPTMEIKSPEAMAEEPAAGAQPGDTEAAPAEAAAGESQEEGQEEEEVPTESEATPVKFSSLFRSA